MRDRPLFRCVLGPLVFISALSFTLNTGYGEEFRGSGGIRGRIGKKAKLLKKDLSALRRAMKMQKMHNEHLMAILGVEGTGTGISPDGEAVVKVFTSRQRISGIPKSLDGVPVRVKVTGRFYALDAPSSPSPSPTERWPRPVPIGVSTGHPNITAGTISARVTDGSFVYALSNNHVYANINRASIGDNVLQPGPFDGGTDPADAIGTLADFEPLIFSNYWVCVIWGLDCNKIDAAIALSSTGDLGYGTPPDGYGSPNSVIHPAYGDPGLIGDSAEDLAQLLGQSVQKYGRTTGLTFGTVDAINAVVNVCYDGPCSQMGTFVDQIIIVPGAFSGGGDSGSLILTNDLHKYPVGLLFAGSDTNTLANPIDRVLNRFNVTIDSGPSQPSLSINDLTVMEGDTGTTDAVFTLSLSSQSAQVVNVDYATSDGTASAGSDYTFATGTISFPAGTTTQWITVAVQGDDIVEPDENFYVNLSNATGASIADAQGEGTILNDDLPAPPPQITIDDVSVPEGNAGTSVDAVFTVSLSASSGGDVFVDYTTSEGSATEGEDYASTSGTLTISAGTTTGSIAVTVQGDDMEEPDETFNLNLFNPRNATISDSQGVGTILNDDAAAPPMDPHLRTGKITASTDSWTTVTLDRVYTDMVVVCTPNYDRSTTAPAVVLVKDAVGNSFKVKLGPAVWSLLDLEPPWTAEVHWMVVEAGVYNVNDHGVKMEAVKFPSTVTDRSGSWVGENRPYGQSYASPVVLGQVMTYNADREYYWSVFWSRGSARKNPPSSPALWAGKHIGEDPRTLNAETIGYIVIEAGQGTIGGTGYVAGVTSDTIRGMGNRPPYRYSIPELSFNPATAIASQTAMDGGNGGWAVLYGGNPIKAKGLNFELDLAIDEDWARDSERKHTSEQVAYILFE